LAPGEKVLVYGSITRTNAFHRRSDVDLAFVEVPKGHSIYRMQVLLEEAVGRPVDLTILGETRLRQKIEQEGELWIG
jgi:predicted nucleotidyltransferase